MSELEKKLDPPLTKLSGSVHVYHMVLVSSSPYMDTVLFLFYGLILRDYLFPAESRIPLIVVLGDVMFVAYLFTLMNSVKLFLNCVCSIYCLS